jgi:Domain of unknown function (DUF4412)
LVYQKKKGYARTKADQLVKNNTPAAGYSILYYSTHFNLSIMRKIIQASRLAVVAALLLSMFAVLPPVTAHAQFLKNLVNNVKQTVQNRANGKADQATNKSLDKVDTSSNSLLGSFAKASSSNPKDTSAADLTMKALGIFAGGGGVSAADSASAIQSFRTASGGSGIFYQYQTLITTKKNPPVNDTSCTWLTNGGEGRAEMTIPMPGVTGGKIISIGHAGQPKYSVQLYPEDKQYGLTVIDTSLLNVGKETYEITRVGTETVNGYSCVHVKMTTTIGSGIFHSKSTEDIWTSTDVPGYSLYKRLTSVNPATKPQMIQALEKAGAGGFFVKMASADKDYSMTMTLVRAEEKSCPASLFEIPVGYTQTDENMIQHMMAGAMKQQAQKQKN